MLRALSLGFTVLLSTNIIAANINLGQPLPDLLINDRGELLLVEEEFSFSPWQLSSGNGKVRIVQYMAGTRGASKLNKPFTDRLKDLPVKNFQVTTVINLDDAMWGTSGFVISELKKNKRVYPLSEMIVDEDGRGLKLWDLQSKSSAIVITDIHGKVLYLKEGAMSEAEILRALQLILVHVEQESS